MRGIKIPRAFRERPKTKIVKNTQFVDISADKRLRFVFCQYTSVIY